MELTTEQKKNIKTLFDLFYTDNLKMSKKLKQDLKEEFKPTYNLFKNELFINFKIIGGKQNV